jgi:hypothetical protein
VRRFVGDLITTRCFRISAPKTENGFVGQENCFIETSRRNNSARKLNDFSEASFTAVRPGRITLRRSAKDSAGFRQPSGFLNFSVGTGLPGRKIVNPDTSPADLRARMQLF